MQVSTLSSLKKTSIAKYLVLTLKLLLLLGMLYFVGVKLWEHQDSVRPMLIRLRGGWYNVSNGWVLAALLLVPVNWVLEAVKWQVLVQRVGQASLSSSLQAVLAGLCLGMVTPRSLGDYTGRILVHGAGHKVRLAGAVLLNRLVQSGSTFGGGLAGLLFLVWHLGLWESEHLLWLLVPGFLGTALMVIFMGSMRAVLITWLQQKIDHKVVAWFAVIREYTVNEICQVNAWALLRYMIFCLQFLFVLWWAGLTAPWPILLAAIGVTFLLKTLLPGFNFLSELGVREFSALLVFSAIGLPHAEVIAASLLLWFMNICLPALAGLGVVLQLNYTPSTAQ